MMQCKSHIDKHIIMPPFLTNVTPNEGVVIQVSCIWNVRCYKMDLVSYWGGNLAYCLNWYVMKTDKPRDILKLIVFIRFSKSGLIFM